MLESDPLLRKDVSNPPEIDDDWDHPNVILLVTMTQGEKSKNYSHLKAFCEINLECNAKVSEEIDFTEFLM